MSLHDLARKGDLEGVEALLVEDGVDISTVLNALLTFRHSCDFSDGMDKLRRTALHLAAFFGHASVVSALIKVTFSALVLFLFG